MKTIGRCVTVSSYCAGFLLLVACGAELETDEPVETSSDDFRTGRGLPRHGMLNGRGRHGHGHGRGHGHGHGHGRGGTGAGGGSGAAAGTGFSGGGGMGTGTSGTGASSGGSSTGGTPAGGAAGFAGSGMGGGSGGVWSGICGDGVWFAEQCEDGNLASGDGCDETCQIEPGFTCQPEGGCREVVCGDSLQDFYAVGEGIFDYEQCDDGNDVAGDGCNEACDVETGFVCPAPGVACREVVCGDGFQDGYVIPGTGGSGGGMPGGSGGMMAGAGGGGGYGTYHFEGCDDGNVVAGDGCSATCVIEDGYICDSPGQPCRVPRCGDGLVDFIPGSGGTGGSGGSGMGGMGGMGGGGSYGTFEECDDGNTSSSDGCDAACIVEPGFACYWPGTPCHAIVCGDGLADWPEHCDDGNAVSGDGCSDCTYDGGGFGGAGGSWTGGTGGGFAMGGAFTMGGSGTGN